ncbi:MAG: hypothetical protein HZB92_01495 [Euryarchaeota archaeon]|nr:hypothetical protein [Euryarchaeota archaeon]
MKYDRALCLLFATVMCLSVLGAASIPPSASPDAGRDYYLVRFSSLPSDSGRGEIAAACGANFLGYLQDNAYLVSVGPGLASRLASWPGVSEFVTLAPESKVSPDLQKASGDIKLRVNFHADANPLAAVEAIESLGATVTKLNTESVYYVECDASADMIDGIASIEEVSWVQALGEKHALMDLISSNAYMGSDRPQSFGFNGSGILAEVQDNGIDRTHPDLSRVTYTDGTVVSDDHGTCTSGIMFGNGAGSSIALGNLYAAVGAFCDWNKGNAASISNLWNGTFNEGSAGTNGVVQTNSWFSGLVSEMDGQYNAVSNEVDTAAVNFPHVLNHWAIGNANNGLQLGGISRDSSNKNGLAVGAIWHHNTSNLAIHDYYGNGSGNTPSRGPCADGRLHPELCGPFDGIFTVDRMGTLGYNTAAAPAGNYYNGFGGTSGATPSVAGCSGLAYEMYRENYFGNNPAGNWPYSCTIKAMMIADAYQYPMSTNNITRYVQGWGTPDMEYMYNLGPTYHVIEEYPQALSAGQSWGRYVYSDGVNPLKVTLCWIDPAAPAGTGAGRALINNLDLRVTSPGGTIYWGNNGLHNALWSVSGVGVNNWSISSSYTDDKNVVENVFVQAPLVGQWRIDVFGHAGDVAQGPQQFSMVASGAKPLSSMGVIALDKDVYRLESTAQVTVSDIDLNTVNTTQQTVNVNVNSTLEPAGETLTLTETGVNTSVFTGNITLSATNGVGIIWVAHGSVVTATYNDANNGTGPATVRDNATVDGQAPGPPTNLTVAWTGTNQTSLASQDFSSATFPPTGWATFTAGTTGTWTRQLTANAGGTSPEAQFMYGTSGQGISRLYCGPISTVGYSTVYLNWANFFNDYAAGCTVNVQTATAAGGPWTNSTWQITSGGGNVGPGIQTVPLTSGVGSATFYFCFAVFGDSYQLDYWYVDNVLLYTTYNTTMDNKLNWTKSVDDGAGANDVAKYNIYRAATSAGPWDNTSFLTSVAKGITNYTDLARGQYDGVNWWYVVRAEDNIGNIEMNTVAVPEQQPNATWANITVTTLGWNLISVPLVTASTGLPGALTDKVNGGAGLVQWDRIQAYAPATPANLWKQYYTGWGASLNDLSAVDHTIGVWVYVTTLGDGQICVGGSGYANSTNASIPLSAGWNMVGYPARNDASYTVGQLKTATGATIVEGFNSTQTYRTSILADASVLKRGQAYWVYVPAPTVWYVDW